MLILICCFLLALIAVLSQYKSAKYAPPTAPGCVPFLGHALSLLRDPVSFCKTLTQTNVEVSTVKIFNRKIYMVHSRDLLHEYFKTPASQISFESALESLNVPYLQGHHDNKSEFNFEASVRFIRRAALRINDELIQSEIEAFINEMPRQGSFEVYHWTQSLIARLQMKIFFGIEFPQQVQEILFEFEERLSKVASASMLIPKWVVTSVLGPLWVNRLREQVYREMEPVVDKILAQEVKTPYMTELLSYVDETTGKPLSKALIVQTVTALLLAGVSNTANAVSETLMNVLENPHLINPIRKDVAEASPKASHLLQACALETARTSAHTFAGSRLVKTDDFYIGDYHIPKDSWLCIAQLGLHADERVFKGADKYDPYRFMDERQEDKGLSHPITTWGGGVHLCPGKLLSMTQIKYIVGNAVQKLDLKYENNAPRNLDFGSLAGVLPRTGNNVISFSKRFTHA